LRNVVALVTYPWVDPWPWRSPSAAELASGPRCLRGPPLPRQGCSASRRDCLRPPL